MDPINPQSYLDGQGISFLNVNATTSVKRAVLAMSMRFTYGPNSSSVMLGGQTRVENDLHNSPFCPNLANQQILSGEFGRRHLADT